MSVPPNLRSLRIKWLICLFAAGALPAWCALHIEKIVIADHARGIPEEGKFIFGPFLLMTLLASIPCVMGAVYSVRMIRLSQRVGETRGWLELALAIIIPIVTFMYFGQRLITADATPIQVPIH